MNGFERVKEKKKRAIKDAALSLFTEWGYKKVKIEDIAKKANVSQVTIYNHFNSKDALFRDIIQEITIHEFQKHQEIAKQCIPFQEKMKHMIVREVKQASIFHPEMIEQMLQKDKELQTFLYTYQEEEILPWFLTLIEEAQHNNEINPSLSKDMILLYIEMFTNLGKTYGAQLLEGDFKKRMNELMTLFFHGICNPK